MNLPLVSVIIPTYNYGHYILDAINSINQQTYPLEKIEVIIIDDGSTDNTSQILAPYHLEGLLKYYYQDNAGKAAATYKAIQYCSGKYIFNLDADDFFLRDRIYLAVEKFEENENIVHIGSPAKKYNNSTNLIVNYEVLPPDLVSDYPLNGLWLLRYFLYNNLLLGGGSTYAARASILKKIDIPSLVNMYIDEFLILAILPYGDSYFINQGLTVWREHSNNYSSAAKSVEKDRIKCMKSLSASSSILAYMQIHSNIYGHEIINLYKLKDTVKRISIKFTLGQKTTYDIINYIFELINISTLNWHTILVYRVLYGVIPSSIYKLLLKLKSIYKIKSA